MLADKDALQEKHPGGREVVIGGQSYQMYAIGNEATAFMTNSPQVRRAMRQLAEETGDEVFEVKDANGVATGIWQQMHYNSDGTLTKRFWAPTTRYRVDDAVGAVNVPVGDMMFTQYDINYGINPMGGGEMPAPKAFETWSEASRQEWFKKCFPAYKDQQVENVRYDNGVYAANINGERTLTFSPTDYGIKQGMANATDIRSVSSAIGSQYTSVTLPSDSKGVPLQGIMDADWSPRGKTAQAQSVRGEQQERPSANAGPGAESSQSFNMGGGGPGSGAPIPQSTPSPTLDSDWATTSAGGHPEKAAAKEAHREGDSPDGQPAGQDGAKDGKRATPQGLSDFERQFLFSRAPEELIPTTLDMGVVGPSADEDTDGHDADDEDEDDSEKPRRKRTRTAREAVAEEEGKVKLSPIIQDAIRRRRKK